VRPYLKNNQCRKVWRCGSNPGVQSSVLPRKKKKKEGKVIFG
jgi:hypothetical protein